MSEKRTFVVQITFDLDYFHGKKLTTDFVTRVCNQKIGGPGIEIDVKGGDNDGCNI